MYTPEAFAQKDKDKIFGLVRDYPLATLVAQGDQGLEAVHLPMVVDDTKTPIVLQGHIAKANLLSKRVAPNSEVILIFTGPNGYISPSYYPAKKEHGRVVPTWNYCAVHCKGRILFVEDDVWNLALLNKLTQEHESLRATPWMVGDAPDEYVTRMLKAIVGIEVRIESIEAKWKLSQNQSLANQQGVIAGLAADDESTLSQLVARCAAHLEPR